MTRLTHRLLVLALGAAPFGAACDEKKPSSSALAADANAGADKYATAESEACKGPSSDPSLFCRVRHGAATRRHFCGGSRRPPPSEGQPDTRRVDLGWSRAPCEPSSARLGAGRGANLFLWTPRPWSSRCRRGRGSRCRPSISGSPSVQRRRRKAAPTGSSQR